MKDRAARGLHAGFGFVAPLFDKTAPLGCFCILAGGIDVESC